MRSHVMTAISGLVLALSFSQNSFAADSYPQGPDLTMTPGAVCTQSNTFRYPEHIKYCNRAVDSGTKRQIIRDYDQNFGYTIESMPRTDFKIDHFIPLCMGGANDVSNLWPQHKSVYEITDPVEPLACQRMAEGKLLQARAIELIKQAKYHLDQVPQVMATLNSL